MQFRAFARTNYKRNLNSVLASLIRAVLIKELFEKIIANVISR